MSVDQVDAVALPGRVRVLRTFLLVVWIAFLPAWLVAMNLGVQPTATLVALTFAVWAGLWAAGHFALRRERCPVCGGTLFAGEAFESLRATQCASCEWQFDGSASRAAQSRASTPDGSIISEPTASESDADGQAADALASDGSLSDASDSDAPPPDASTPDARAAREDVVPTGTIGELDRSRPLPTEPAQLPAGSTAARAETEAKTTRA